MANAIDYLKENQPEITALCLSLPDIDSMQLCEFIRKENHNTKIIGITYANDTPIIMQLLHREPIGIY